MDVQSIVNILGLAGTAFAIYLGLRKLPGEMRRDDAAAVHDYADAASATVATNKTLQERIEKLQARLDALEATIELKDKRIVELEGITADQDAKIAIQSTMIIEQAGRILQLQAEINELRRRQNGYMNGDGKDLSS